MHFFVAEIFVVDATKRGFFEQSWKLLSCRSILIWEKKTLALCIFQKKIVVKWQDFYFLLDSYFVGINTQLQMKYLDHVIFVSVKKGDIMENVQESQNLS